MPERNSPLTKRQRFWLEHLRVCGRRSLKGYAQANGLSVGALYAAKSELKRRGLLEAAKAPRFARVVREDSAGAPTLCRARLVNGVTLEVACEPDQWPSLLVSLAALP